MESKQLTSKPDHPSPSSDYSHTAVPSKKPKHHHHHHHHHSDGKAVKKEKHGKSDKHSKMSRPDGKTVTVKKEPITPVKKKPMISESESEDDIPLAQLHTSTVHAVPTTVNVVQKMEVSPSHREVKKEKFELSGSIKQGGHTSTIEDDVPLAQRKAHLLSSQSSSVLVKSEVPSSPAKMITPTKSQPPKPTSTSAPPPDRKKTSAAKAGTKRKKAASQTESDDEDEEFKPSGKKAKKTPTSAGKKRAASATPAKKASAAKKKSAVKQEATASPTKGGRKKKEEEKEVWKWWEEEPLPEGVKWLTLEHKGPCFAPPYERLPPDVKFVYNGKEMELSEKAEEAAGFFAKMLDHDYTKKDVFCDNFFQDWRLEMTSAEAKVITDFEKCDFTQIHQHYKERSELRKQMSKEEKLKIKEENERLLEEFGWCMIDHHRERIGNFKIEPPGLFRGRGDHPKQGKIKKRIEAKDVIINIGKDAEVPKPPEGHRWKSVQHDNKVTWLASWTENIQGAIKYVMLNPTSRLKAEKDLAKYETARKLKEHVDKIREQYMADWRSKEMKIRQRAVAVYFIDKLALRAGNEKDSDETADTVGCCSLRCEHIKLHEQMNGKDYVVEFDFLGKDSIRYYNAVPVEKQVFKNLSLFMRDKDGGDDLFDRLNTITLNKHLSELMPGLTAKVFRTYNASKTLQDQLLELTEGGDAVPSKLLSYNRANRAVAVLCNHQRAPPKTFDQQMTNLNTKIQAKEDAIMDTKKELKALKKEAKTTKDSKTTKKLESKKKQLARLEEQLQKLEVQATDKQENKEIALGTSKLNYLDPRISVAWCKKWDVPVEKVYNKTQREKFAWAIDMATEDFVF